MSDSVSVSGPVEVKTDSNARVAFDLMSYISGWEQPSDTDKQGREYWLTLYWQCYQAASGHSLSTVLRHERQ